ncbi:hypothetical protein AFLA_001525 [Aspergillus flavus NRRL3357]|nr:hypothetical protein AFLA_001525 [Aspergillus flavus NRRL3357]
MILCVSFLLIPDPAADTTRTVSGIRLCCYANKLANNRDQHGPLVSRIVSRISACETIVDNNESQRNQPSWRDIRVAELDRRWQSHYLAQLRGIPRKKRHVIGAVPLRIVFGIARVVLTMQVHPLGT